MKIKGIVVNRQDRQRGRSIIRWAATGMNFQEGESLERFKAKAKGMLGNPVEELRVGRAVRPFDQVWQSMAHDAIEGLDMSRFFE